MKRSSASVLALLFASSNAIKLNGVQDDTLMQAEAYYDKQSGLWRQLMAQKHRNPDDEPTAVRAPPESHIGTDVYSHAMNASEGIPGNRDHTKPPSLAQKSKKVDPISPENYDPWVYKFSKEQMGAHPQWHMDDNLEFRNAHIGYSQVGHKHRHHKNPNEAIIGTENIDEEVQDFASKHTTGLHQKKHHKKDVAERGMDEEVHGLVWHAIPPLNTRVKSEDPFVPNGSDPSAHSPDLPESPDAAFSEKKHHKKHSRKHHKKDVAERGMDEEVHGLVWHAIPPLNTRVKSEDPFVPNGSDPSAHSPDLPENPDATLAEKKHHRKHKKKDVAERGMDEEVHGFVNEMVTPINVRLRSDVPWVPNGSDPSAHSPDLPEEPDAAFAEKDHHKKHHRKHHKKDVAERGMDEEVHGLVWHALPPLNTRVRSTEPFIPNGSDPSAHSPDLPENPDASFAEKKHHRKHKKKDVAERGMDEEVHGFVNEMVTPINVRLRSDIPWVPNGSEIGDWYENTMSLGQRQSLAQDQGPDNLFGYEHGLDTNESIYMNKAIPAQSDRPVRLEDAPEYNGYKNMYPQSFAQKKDIAETGVESDYVYPLSSGVKPVEPLPNPWLRPYLPYEANGGSNVYAQVEPKEPKEPSESKQKDISHNEVRPDVWNVVHQHLNPVALGRFREPRSETAPEVRTWDEGPAPKEAATEYKFKKPEEPDEELHAANVKAKADKGKAIAKQEKAAKEAEDALPDEDVPKAKSTKTPLKEDEEEEKKAQVDAAETKKIGEAAEKEDKAAVKAKAELDAEIKAI